MLLTFRMAVSDGNAASGRAVPRVRSRVSVQFRDGEIVGACFWTNRICRTIEGKN